METTPLKWISEKIDDFGLTEDDLISLDKWERKNLLDSLNDFDSLSKDPLFKDFIEAVDFLPNSDYKMDLIWKIVSSQWSNIWIETFAEWLSRNSDVDENTKETNEQQDPLQVFIDQIAKESLCEESNSKNVLELYSERADRIIQNLENEGVIKKWELCRLSFCLPSSWKFQCNWVIEFIIWEREYQMSMFSESKDWKVYIKSEDELKWTFVSIYKKLN